MYSDDGSNEASEREEGCPVTQLELASSSPARCLMSSGWLVEGQLICLLGYLAGCFANMLKPQSRLFCARNDPGKNVAN